MLILAARNFWSGDSNASPASKGVSCLTGPTDAGRDQVLKLQRANLKDGERGESTLGGHPGRTRIPALRQTETGISLYTAENCVIYAQASLKSST